MRLLLTTDTVGGVWTFNVQLAHALLSLGCEVALVSFGWRLTPWQRGQVDELTARFTGRCTLYTCTAALEWMPDNRTAYQDGEALLLQVCAHFQPAALLCSQFCWGALPVQSVKIVIAHSDVLSWAEAVGKAPLADDAWLSAYRVQVQAGLDGAHFITAPTAAMLEDLCRNFRVGNRASVIPNGIALQPEPAAPRTLQAVTAGRMWDEAKNLALLSDLVSPVPVLVAGEQRVDLQAPSPASRVTLLGQLPHTALLTLLSGSAMYLCTSLYEPFGLAALEAARCGCAVLANDIPSLREVWDDAALYFHDASSLSSLLTRLVSDAGLLAAAQARAYCRSERYTAEAMGQRYLQLARDLTGTTTLQEGEHAHAV